LGSTNHGPGDERHARVPLYGEGSRDSSRGALEALDRLSAARRAASNGRRPTSSDGHSTYSNPVSSNIRASDLSPEEIAQNLTLMESRLYTDLTPYDCIIRDKPKDKEGTSKRKDPFERIMHRHQQIAAWVEFSTLLSPNPPHMISRWINVAFECRRLQNFSAMTAIVLALQRHHIQRQKLSWKRISPEARDTLTGLATLIDHNFRTYRHEILDCRGPTVPVFVVHYGDMKMQYANMPPVVRGRSGVLHHFSRFAALYSAIPLILRYQEPQHTLAINPENLKCVEGQVRAMELTPGSEAELERLSKEKRDQTKAAAGSLRTQRDILDIR